MEEVVELVHNGGSGAAGGAGVDDAVESGGDWGGVGGTGRAEDLQRVVGVGLDRGGTPGFYYLGRREGYVKIQEGQVVVFSGFLLRETLKDAQFTWSPSDKTWRQPLNQALRVLRIDVEEPRVGEDDDDLVITRAIASIHNNQATSVPVMPRHSTRVYSSTPCLRIRSHSEPARSPRHTCLEYCFFFMRVANTPSPARRRARQEARRARSSPPRAGARC